MGLGGVNPPLNAARLDIVHSRLWGTAESVRTTLVSISTGLSPIVFGVVSTALGDSGTSDSGLGDTFLVMLVTLVVAAALISVCRASHVSARRRDRDGLRGRDSGRCSAGDIARRVN